MFLFSHIHGPLWRLSYPSTLWGLRRNSLVSKNLHRYLAVSFTSFVSLASLISLCWSLRCSNPAMALLAWWINVFLCSIKVLQVKGKCCSSSILSELKGHRLLLFLVLVLNVAFSPSSRHYLCRSRRAKAFGLTWSSRSLENGNIFPSFPCHKQT